MNPPEFESVNNNTGNNNPGQFNNFNPMGGPQNVPNSVGVLVLGILSIIFCWCYGILAIILGIIALVLAGQGEKAYTANPQAYTLASLQKPEGRPDLRYHWLIAWSGLYHFYYRLFHCSWNFCAWCV